MEGRGRIPLRFALAAATALLAALALAAGVLMVRGRRNLGFEWCVAAISTGRPAFATGTGLRVSRNSSIFSQAPFSNRSL